MTEPIEPQYIAPLVPVQPDPPNLGPTGPEPVRQKRKPSPFVRVGIVTGTAALVLVGAIAAMGASPAPSGSTTTPTTPSASGDPFVGGMGPGRWGGKGDLDHMDFGGPGRGFGAITIASISGSNLSLRTDDGWTRTITTTSTTEITKAGATIAVSDLAVGDEIRFAQTKATDGSYSITKIVVVMPSQGGEVTAKTSDTITVTRRDGTTATIKVNGSTKYTVEGVENATLADIAVGMHLRAEGTDNADGSLDASSVMAGVGGRGHDGFGRDGGGRGPGHGWDDDGKAPGASPNPSAAPG